MDAADVSDGSSSTDRPDAMPIDASSPDGAPGSCGYVGPEVRAHIMAMQSMGWGALNRARSMMMYGCSGTARPQDCLARHAPVGPGDIGNGRSALAGATLRLLYSASTRSSYWTRGSPDGRFVARGVYIHDMIRDVEIRAVGAQYDPAFFPDNSGYIYQPNGRMCPMSTLTTGMPSSVAISGTGSQCAGSSVGLYQHLGASLDGADYWATSAGTAAWDNGGTSPTLTETRRNETWGANASTVLTLMANTGSGFVSVGQRSVRTPYQGDAVITPSSRMLLTRFVDTAGAYQGYILNRLTASHVGAAITAEATEVARYCVQGAKPALSYDERYAVFHHYIGGGASVEADARELGFSGASDPGFAPYRTQGAANIYILDLLTARVTRVTTMAPGQYALYPFFRNDGWIYFIVRTLGTTQEHAIASDALFHLR